MRWYLYRQACGIAQAGVDLVLDFGLWSQKERQEIREFFQYRSMEFSIHYINTSLAKIRSNIDKRNLCVNELNYFIDDAILDKCLSLFEIPTEDEIDESVQINM